MQHFYQSHHQRFVFVFLAAFFCSLNLATAQVSISCPDDIFQGNDLGQCSAIVDYTTPVGTGSGTNITTTLIAGLPSGADFPVGVTSITYEVSNDEGASSQCQFFVVVTDEEDPVFDCPLKITVDANTGECSAIVFFDIPDATDNCAVVDVFQSAGLPSGSAFPVGESSVDFQAFDSEGNLGFCRIVIEVIDTTDPTIDCPSDITVEVTDACEAVVNYTEPVGVDACGPSITALTSGLGSGATFPLGTSVETYTVTDLEGNTASCSFNIDVVDVAPPVITCPDDIVVSAAADACEANVSFTDATATDNCPGVNIVQTEGPASGSLFPTGETTITFAATDASGNVSECSFTVTVNEDVLPEISCPADITAGTDPGECTAVVSYTPPTGTDNCPGATTALSAGIGSGGTFPIGVSTETYTVTDASGNTAECSFTITVEDSEAPVFDCPTDITATTDPGSCDATVTFSNPDATDNCPGVTVAQTDGPLSGSLFPAGSTEVTFTATDAEGNTSACSFNIVVNDEEVPTIACPANITVPAPAGTCEAEVTYALPVADDNCPGVSIALTSGPASGDLVAVGTQTVTFEATDAAGNTAECSFEITVEDTDPPVFTCPTDLVVSTDAGECEATVSFPAPTATDACGDLTVTQTDGPVSGSIFPLGTTVVEFTAEDESGNTSTCSINIVVEDQESPIITCPANIEAPASAGACEAAVTFDLPTFSDNCPGGSIVQTNGPVSGSIFPVGSTEIEFTATDAAGNSTICTTAVLVNDEELPTITCPADVEILLPDGDCDGTISYPDPVVDDNCPGVTFALIDGPASGTTVTAGAYTITFEATDASGNTATCSFTVTLVDTGDPVFDCPADITAGNDAGECNAVVSFAAPTATDNCSDVTVTQTGGPTSGSTFPLGSTAVEFTAEDESGNTSTCTFNIVVEDQESPVIDCPGSLELTAAAGQCSATVTFGIPSFTDNCPGGSIVQTDGPASGSSFPVGSTEVEFTATDDAGNTSTCVRTIVVNDEELPTITCPADVEILLPDGDCDGTISYPDPVVDDNCPGVTFALIDGPASGTTVTAGAYTITFEATDASGNTATCSFTVTLVDTGDPVFDCPADITAGNDAGECNAVVSFAAPTATDNCSDVTVTQTGGPTSGSTFPLGSTAVEFTAEDESGNTSTCTFNIVVEDQESPVIDCPGSLELTAAAGQCSATVTFGIPSFTDNCPGGSIVQTDGPASGSSFPVGSTEVEFTATDDAGNTSTCVLTIVVNDEELPTITCPDDVSLSIANDGCEGTISYGDPVADDNCPGVTFTLIEGPASGATITAGTYSITFEATDASGNTSTCSFEVTLEDSNDPTFDCPADLSVPADAGGCDAVVTFEAPTASDPCTDVTVTQTGGPASGSTFPAGSTAVEFTAEDEFGNSSTCTFNVIVVDDSPPEIECIGDLTVDNDPGDCGAIVNYTVPTGTDNCGDVTITLISGPASGDFIPVGDNEVVYEAADLSGNTVQCSFVITVEDTEAPIVTCPADINITLPDGDCDTVVNYALPAVSDNCPETTLTLTAGPASGETFSVGATTVTFEAVDDAGNTASCSFTVTVTENVSPTIDCPGDITVNNNAGECGAVVTYTAPEGLDNCPGATTSLTSGLGSGATFPLGTSTETYTVTDLSGNEASCSFTVTVVDAESPIITCPENIVVGNDPGQCEATVSYDLPEVTDNCDDSLTPALISGPASGAVLAVGVYTVTYEVSDLSGNTAECSFTITVEDDESPVITCPDDIVVDAASGECDAVVTYGLPTVDDNCGIASTTLIEGPASGSLFPVGISTIVFETTDVNGNSETCSFTVTVNEDVPPVITCPDDIVQANSQGLCGAIVNYNLPEASDDCGDVIISLIEGPVSGAEFPLGSTTVTYEATDISGNSVSCSFQVTITDEEAPAFECPGPVLQINTDEGSCEAVYNFDLPVVSDNCEVATLVQVAGPASGASLPLGETTFSFTATDNAGNESTCTYTVEVTDNEAPVLANCPVDFDVFVGDDNCSAIVDFVAPTATDNCSVSLEQISGPASGETLAPGEYTVSFEATDPSGNVSTCEFTVSVLDNIAPEFACPDTLQSCAGVVTFDAPIATDNCTDVEVLQIGGPESGSQFPLGSSTVTFEATDASGNSATCSFVVEVLPTAPRAEAGVDRNICGSTTATLNGNPPGDALGTWTIISGTGDIVNPNANSTNVENLGTGANVFVWTLDPQNGCDVESDTLTITVEPGVSVDAGSDQLIIAGGQAALQATASPANGTFLWFPSQTLSCEACANPVATPSESTLYFVQYTSPLGCEVTDSVTVNVFRDLPNTITPNNDGVNDVWNIPGIANFPNVQVVIYNRWGTEVFNSTGYREPWDGTRNGDLLPAGSYFYMIDYRQSGTENLNGTVNIIR